jgi:abortive infection bacteriophage resistance protein
MKFTKPALSIDDQLALMRRRGMAIADETDVRHYLKHISYYRLRAYWLAFEVPADPGDHAFCEDTCFEDVLALYVFDRQLRLLVLDAVERVEVALRAGWAHHMAMTHGSHSYLDGGLHARADHHAYAVTALTEEFARCRDAFAEHYRATYTDPVLPPVWVAAEVISFGQLSKWISNLERRSDRQAIAKPFGFDEKTLISFAHHMNYVRNICAHHGRLWNKRFTVTMAVPKFPAKLPVAMRGAHDRMLHNTLVMLDHMLGIIASDSGWRGRLVTLIDGCPQVDPVAMGFPADWRARAAWRVAV